MLIGITGMPGAGKGAIYKVAKKLNIPIISMGDVVRHETIKRGLELNPKNVGDTAIWLRKKYGKEAIAVACLNYINEKLKDEEIIIIEGLRSLYEADYLRKHRPLIIIAIHASPKTRFERLKSRGREDDPRDIRDFIERDLRELNFGIGECIALADFMVVNENKDYDTFLKELEEVIKKIIENKERFKEQIQYRS
ncbi:AAA family ATPase [Methanocaldococcus infernus]